MFTQLQNPSFLNAFLDRAEQLFLHPAPDYRWQDIITGVGVKTRGGLHKRMAAVGTNTFRGFHKLDKSNPGAAEAFKGHLIAERAALLQDLRAVGSAGELHAIENRLCAQLKARLSNIKPAMLGSYNKIRKPLDLYLEHLAAMAVEMAGHRERLIPHLFLPLDSQMFAAGLFSDRELRLHGVSTASSYADVTSERAYLGLQELLGRKAEALSQRAGRPFHRIYFDLIWNERYLPGGDANLFGSNP